jgi:two-component system OmpR family sensor kinase
LNSIRFRLVLWLTVALAVSSLFVGLIAYQLAWDGFNRLRDYSLEQIAFTILQHEVNPSPDADQAGQYLSQVWNADGSLRFSTRPEIKLPLYAPGAHHLDWQGEEWHIVTVTEGERFVQVANTAVNRRLMFGEIRLWLGIPLTILVLLLGTLIAWIVEEVLMPVNSLRQEILSREPGQLEPLTVAEHPAEIAPLVNSINDLLTRLDHLLSKQRRFVADAAHEMRTPLTAIKLQAQVMAASLTAEDRQTALAALCAGVDRSAHLIEQLLQLARYDAESIHTIELQPCRPAQVARELVVEFARLAEDGCIDLGLGHCDDGMVAADEAGLRILLGNLIDNALRYAGDGSRVDVEVRAVGDQMALWVIDTGPGIPLESREQVFERFCRLASADIPGTGLGLAIVRDIVDLHRGQIHLLDTPGGGLSIRVDLPRL